MRGALLPLVRSRGEREVPSPCVKGRFIDLAWMRARGMLLNYASELSCASVYCVWRPTILPIELKLLCVLLPEVPPILVDECCVLGG